jgi:hypothetical protein
MMSVLLCVLMFQGPDDECVTVCSDDECVTVCSDVSGT